MQSRPVVTSFLVLTAGLAVIAAPRLLPVAGASAPDLTPDIPEVVETNTESDSETAQIETVIGESELDGRDAVADAGQDAAAEVVTERPKPDPVAKRSRDIDLVIALDTSGSMEGLLDSARSRLWDIVNATAAKDPNARIRVGLVTFGSPGVAGQHEGFVAVRSDLTTDLDTLYGQVMALRTDGGEEYVGWTLHTALTQLSWSRSSGAAKIIFIAGNESADQAREHHDFRTVAQQAREQGIVINAMFAGNADQGQRERWGEVATSGAGFYTAIDQQRGTYQVATPHDEKLRELNYRLNDTYLGYGAKGEEGKRNQVRQDGNAVKMGIGSLGSRVQAKSTGAYDNVSWDIVDGLEAGAVDLDTLAPSALPAPMQDMEAEEREQFVNELKNKRQELQREIAEVSKKRARHVQKEASEADDGAFDEAVIEALEEQL